MYNFALSGSFDFVEKRNGPPRIDVLRLIFLTFRTTSFQFAIFPLPASHAFLIAFNATSTARYAGGPNDPSVALGLSFFHPSISALLDAIPLMSGAKFDTYEPVTLNWSGLFDPSPPNTFARLPCSSSCCANVCASDGCCVGKNTTSASPGTRVTREEKSVVLTDVDRRVTDTLRFFSTVSAASARPTEYGSWKSTIATFLALSLSTM